jgi:hypothetical protein
MGQVLENEEKLKELFKSAIVEVLYERRDLIRSVLDEVLEEIALSRAIDEGENSPVVSRDQVFQLLETAN